jgi:hypothetical protein
MGLGDFFKRRGTTGSGTVDTGELTRHTSALNDATKAIDKFIDRMTEASKVLCDSVKCSESATEAQKALNEQMRKGQTEAGESTEQLDELNDSLRKNKTASDDASESNEKLNSMWEKGKELLEKYGATLTRVGLAWRFLAEHTQAAKRAQEDFSKGAGQMFGNAPGGRLEAFQTARKMKAVLDEAATAAVDLGFEVDEGLQAISAAQQRLGSSSLQTGAQVRQVTKDILLMQQITGQDQGEVVNLYEKAAVRFRKSTGQTTKELIYMRKSLEDLRSGNNDLYIATDEYVGILAEAQKSTKFFAHDNVLLTHTVSTLVDKTYKQTKNQEYALQVAKDTMKIFEEPPPWMDVSITSQWLDQALNDMDSFMDKIKDETPEVREQVRSVLNDLRSGALDRENARELIGEALHGTRSFNAALIDEGKKLLAGGGNIRTLQATFGLDAKAARGLFEAIQSGDLDHLDALNKQADAAEKQRDNLEASTKALHDAADESQGLGKHLNNMFRNDWVKAGVFGLTFLGGGALLKGAGGMLGRLFGGGATTSGGAVGGVKGLVGNLLGGGGKGCVDICSGGLGDGENGLSSIAEQLGSSTKGASRPGLLGRASRFLRGGNLLKSGLKFGGILATGINAIGNIRDVYDAIGSSKPTSEKTAAISSAIGDTALDVSLGYLTGGIFPLVKSLFRKQYDQAVDASVEWGSHLFESMEERRKFGSGVDSAEEAQRRAQSGEIRGNTTRSAAMLMRDIYDGNKVRPEYMWLVHNGLLSGQLNDARVETIRKAIENKQNAPFNAFVDRAGSLPQTRPSIQGSTDPLKGVKIKGARVNNQGKMVANVGFEFENLGQIFGHLTAMLEAQGKGRS